MHISESRFTTTPTTAASALIDRSFQITAEMRKRKPSANSAATNNSIEKQCSPEAAPGHAQRRHRSVSIVNSNRPGNRRARATIRQVEQFPNASKPNFLEQVSFVM
jgi:hypothetical protein